jgi:hypothetical protein
MLYTRKAWSFLGAAAIAAYLAVAPAQGQDSFHMVAHENTSENSEEASELRSEISELRASLKNSTSTAYDQGPSCGCAAHAPAAHGCGCGGEISCGCDTGCCDAGCGCGDCCGCCESCCHSGGYWAMGELLWFKYHRADGARVGTGEVGDDADAEFEMTPRLTVGYVRCDGLGVRARYWQFDHAIDVVENAGSALVVDTYTFDFEVFDTFCLNPSWDLELAAGIRYTDFLEVMADIPGDNDIRFNEFTGFGGVVSAELRRCIGTSGNIWFRTRSAILMDDKTILNDPGQGQFVQLVDVTVGMTEIAFGYDYVMPICCGGYYFAGIQAEWQNWYNFSSGFEDTENNEDFAGPADVGFAGFGFRAGIAR